MLECSPSSEKFLKSFVETVPEGLPQARFWRIQMPPYRFGEGFRTGDAAVAAWQEQMLLPISIVMVIYLDPLMPSACAISLIGIVKWAIQMSLELESDICWLTMSAEEDFNFLSRTYLSRLLASMPDILDIATTVQLLVEVKPGGFKTYFLTICGELSALPPILSGYDEIHIILGFSNAFRAEWDELRCQMVVSSYAASREDRQLQLWWIRQDTIPSTLIYAGQAPQALINAGGSRL
ncbi:hypothetical protein FNAPI_12623 [Fusarium napiforme]|uniref:Uncharacterized protein n=1 Tax=Fusarium napiforme TaxID=42672 RepID=A0A8H5IB11_9HYPO|nr:hypothetical protein FNAPI_12623 [Fusarium napiforme]